MLDAFEIFTKSGVVLWSRSFSPVPSDLINNFINDVFIEEKGSSAAVKDTQSAATNTPYKSDQHTVKWTYSKELGIIFVAVYRSLLHLAWIDKLVDNIKTLFVDLYGDQLTKPHTTLVECHKFDEYFDQQLRQLEKLDQAGSGGFSSRAAQAQRPLEEETLSGNLGDEPPPLPSGLTYRGRALQHNGAANDETTSTDNTPIATPNTSRPSTPGGAGGSHLLTAKAGPAAKLSRRARKVQHAAGSAPASSGDEAPRRAKNAATAGKTAKKGRKWDADGLLDEDDDVQLDYSAASEPAAPSARASGVDSVDASTWGTKTAEGRFVLKDLDSEVNDILAAAEARDAASKQAALASKASSGGLVGSSLNTISGLFKNVVGGKTLTQEDVAVAMKGMEDHLLKKNVALEAAVRLCEGVSKELVGVKMGSFESINSKIKAAMEKSLTKMLTPTSSLDLIRDIDAVTKPARGSGRSPRPYVVSIVGVNGVGKSTNLSKMAFFLLENGYRVLIAAGDTFRSGAVEQLGVHVRNLKELVARSGGSGAVELYQKGYGKDAALVARDAVAQAAAEGFDVVLIDTAGRRHNDQRLMSSLEKFAKFAQPDKILMVGEALVGNDSVAQARNFNNAFGASRKLDGFIISKCDTVNDMVGTLVSLVHATNVPILFVGIGQHYPDLRNFNVHWAVEKLLSSN